MRCVTWILHQFTWLHQRHKKRISKLRISYFECGAVWQFQLNSVYRLFFNLHLLIINIFKRRWTYFWIYQEDLHKIKWDFIYILCLPDINQLFLWQQHMLCNAPASAEKHNISVFSEKPWRLLCSYFTKKRSFLHQKCNI